ncbi:MAG: sensor histidine kinase [Ferrimicrobium sp.]|uniref:sensor histidine kinase n=1 Tax=Ferrimicrobium sp. TaxID=2926050 RepID=UPI00262EA7D3|nr:ATP-binding protein [Ferrimicrobium sp.]
MEDRTSTRVEDAELWSRAAASLSIGVVLVDADYHTVYSDYADKIPTGGFAERILLERAISALKHDARLELYRSQTLEVFGPPKSYFQLVTTPLGSDPHPPFIITVENITERKRLEEVRRDFVANVSHELKTPVGGIVLLADALSQESDPATVLRLSRRILDEGDRLARLVTDLLDLSKLEETELHQIHDVNLNEIASECVDRYRLGAEARGIGLEVTFAPDPPIVSGDRWQLSSALSNLIDNAIKYSEPGTEVRVTIAISADSVEAIIADRGIGIPARDLSRIFERFYRVDADRSRATGGTGLGLSIVRHVIENHQGKIDVTSTEGVGTTFTISLPRVPA